MQSRVARAAGLSKTERMTPHQPAARGPHATGGRDIARALLLFGFVFALQLGHLIEHIAKVLLGRGLLGADADSELSHMVFNASIAVLAVFVVRAYLRNPWVYPLVVLCLLHGVEHAYIFERYLRTGLSDGPGLFGEGGVIGLIPLQRLDLHNVYNGVEMILIALGLWHECDTHIAEQEASL